MDNLTAEVENFGENVYIYKSELQFIAGLLKSLDF